jgi:hypothetical protein
MATLLATALIGAGIVYVLAEDAGKPAATPEPDVKKLKAAMDLLRPLHTVLGKPQPGDWLVSHPEDGQTFDQYLACKPVTARGNRNVIYVQPLGDFTATQRKIVRLTAKFCRENGLKPEQEFYEKSIQALGGTVPAEK